MLFFLDNHTEIFKVELEQTLGYEENLAQHQILPLPVEPFKNTDKSICSTSAPKY